MANPIKVRARFKEDVTEVKALISHPMESGRRKDKKTGETIPAHFIQEVVCTWKEKEVMKALWSGGISKNPYIAFRFKGADKGDAIRLSWTDNKGESGSTTAEIK
ncbi:MAG: thiosulfate oxidation carrier complex protein SoxZ [Candidatus Thiosymbion ectosymbiont of Robbea hypermnestra]|nr:thiosulfate oxidation carrier complex protein SoxZ [Candidatus Thiosymbion ectosymbiont of Robbea hypermnestra]